MRFCNPLLLGPAPSKIAGSLEGSLVEIMLLEMLLTAAVGAGAGDCCGGNCDAINGACVLLTASLLE